VYEAFWHLERAPFVVTPDVRFLLRARSHHESLSALLTGSRARPGSWSSSETWGPARRSCVRALCAELSEDVRSVLVINPYLSGAELIGAILDDLGVARAGSTHGERMAALARHLLAVGAEGQSVVVIVDEAQQMSVEALEQIRILSTIEMPGKKLLQVVLVGHPELLDKLGRRELYQLDQRVGVRCRSSRCPARDTYRYVEHRLRVAGLVGALPFTRAALVEVYRATRGIPRVINLVSDRALARAFSARAEEVTPVHVKGAVRDVAPRTRPPRRALARATAWRDGAREIIRWACRCAGRARRCASPASPWLAAVGSPRPSLGDRAAHGSGRHHDHRDRRCHRRR
jgi:general secretion pathway protein A